MYHFVVSALFFCVASGFAIPIDQQPIYLMDHGVIYSQMEPSEEHFIYKRAAGDDISKGDFWAKQIPPPTPRPVFAQANMDGAGNLFMQGKGRVVDTTNHQLDATLSGARNVKHPDMWTKHGALDYVYKPNGSGASVSAVNHPMMGTKVTGQGTYNFFHDKTTTMGVTAGRGQMGLGPREPVQNFGMFNYRRTF